MTSRRNRKCHIYFLRSPGHTSCSRILEWTLESSNTSPFLLFHGHSCKMVVTKIGKNTNYGKSAAGSIQ